MAEDAGNGTGFDARRSDSENAGGEAAIRIQLRRYGTERERQLELEAILSGFPQ